MKKIILIAIAAVSFNAMADLKTNMEALSAAYKQLGKQIQIVSKKTENLKLADDIETAVIECSKQIPRGVAENSPAHVEYKSQMNSLHNLSLDLKLAIQEDRTDDAIVVLDDMRVAKKKGHAEFK